MKTLVRFIITVAGFSVAIVFFALASILPWGILSGLCVVVGATAGVSSLFLGLIAVSQWLAPAAADSTGPEPAPALTTRARRTARGSSRRSGPWHGRNPDRGDGGADRSAEADATGAVIVATMPRP